MKATPLEIRGTHLKKRLLGYDANEVGVLKELAAEALEEASRETTRLEERLKDAVLKLSEHEAREEILKDSITTAQRMVEDIKGNARKEAELIVAEARLQAERIVDQAQRRSIELQEEIFRLRKQRIEIETSIKAILDYHSTTLLMEETDSRKADEGSDKLKFLHK